MNSNATNRIDLSFEARAVKYPYRCTVENYIVDAQFRVGGCDFRVVRCDRMDCRNKPQLQIMHTDWVGGADIKYWVDCDWSAPAQAAAGGFTQLR